MANNRKAKPLPLNQSLVLAIMALEKEMAALDPAGPTTHYGECAGAVLTLRSLLPNPKPKFTPNKRLKIIRRPPPRLR